MAEHLIISDADDITINSLFMVVGSGLIKHGSTIEPSDKDSCYPVTSVDISGSMGTSSGGGSSCRCTVIPSPLSDGEHTKVGEVSFEREGQWFLKDNPISSKASVYMTYTDKSGTTKSEVLYVGYIGSVLVKETGSLGSYSLSYDVDIVHPAVVITNKTLNSPVRFSVSENKLARIHPLMRNSRLNKKTSASLSKSSEKELDICALVLDGLDAGAVANAKSSTLNDITVRNIVDVSSRPVLNISGVQATFGKPLANQIATAVYDSSCYKSPWSIFVDAIQSYGMSVAPILVFDYTDADPDKKDTKYSTVGAFLPFRSFESDSGQVTISIDQILAYFLLPPHADDVDSAAIAVPIHAGNDSNKQLKADSYNYMIVNAGHTKSGQPFYVCGTIDTDKSKHTKDSASSFYSQINISPITTRGAKVTTTDKAFEVVDMPKWCMYPGDITRAADDNKILTARKNFAEFWGNCHYARKSNSFGQLVINIPLTEALKLRGSIGHMANINLSNDTMDLVGAINGIQYSISVKGKQFSTGARLTVVAVRSIYDDKVLALPSSTLKRMYLEVK